jgi:hypothetical protein
MRIEIRLRIVADDNRMIREDEILHFDKGDDQQAMIPSVTFKPAVTRQAELWR